MVDFFYAVLFILALQQLLDFIPRFIHLYVVFFVKMINQPDAVELPSEHLPPVLSVGVFEFFLVFRVKLLVQELGLLAAVHVFGVLGCHFLAGLI